VSELEFKSRELATTEFVQKNVMDAVETTGTGAVGSNHNLVTPIGTPTSVTFN
jgi:hypothetical protein